MKTPTFLIALTLLGAACGSSDDGGGGADGGTNTGMDSGSGATVNFENQGRLCLYAGEPTMFEEAPQEFAENAPVTVRVVFDECLSSSCSDDLAASCQFLLDTTDLQIMGSASYTDTSNAAGPGCTADCVVLEATCATAALAAGTYTVTYGTESLTLTIPSTAQTPLCMGM